MICPWTSFSKIFPGAGNKEMGLQFVSLVLSPPFGMGMTLAQDQTLGNIDFSREQLFRDATLPYLKESYFFNTRLN